MATSDQVQMSSLLVLGKVMEAANAAGVEHPRTQGEMTQEMRDAIHTKQGRWAWRYFVAFSFSPARMPAWPGEEMESAG